MKNNALVGVIAAIVTPVNATGEPDFDKFRIWAEYLLDNGCDGLNVLGTTGEATSFSSAQRLELMTRIRGAGLPMDRLMVGTGAASVHDAALLTKAAADLGFAGALVLPPFYYKGVPDGGIVRYFDRIVEATSHRPVPLYLYNFPALSGIKYEPALVETLARKFGPRIRGLKDSSGDMEYARAIAKLPYGIDVFPSNESALDDARAGTFAGCISATANVNASYCQRAFHDGDADALQKARAVRLLFNGSHLVPSIKAVVSDILGDMQFADVLPPFEKLSAADAQQLVSNVKGV